MKQFWKASIAISLFNTLTFSTNSLAQPEQQQVRLEEIIVSAQKREQSLQETPIAVTVVTSEQLELHAINDLKDFEKGYIPFLHVMPLGNSSSNTAFSIRGAATRDTGDITRETSVGFYMDGVYIARSQGLGMELVDVDHIEVLRGPQGSLFGRNAVGGAVNLISKKPTGEFDLAQTITVGRFDELRSLTHINLPELQGLKTKMSLFHSERNGWINNPAPGESDYTEYNKNGGRLTLNWQASENLTLDYSYDKSKTKDTQNYYQFYVDRLLVFGDEKSRLKEARLPATPLNPTVNDSTGHTLTVSWSSSEHITLRSISAYRKLREDVDTNYNGIVYYNGYRETSNLKQEQYTQEFQLIGKHDRIEWITGLYYLEEKADKTSQTSFTLDIFGNFGPALEAISPPITFPPTIIDADAKSQAIFGQITLELSDNFYLTLGGRYTEDERTSIRQGAVIATSDQESEHFDTTAIFEYRWANGFSAYIKRSTAYKAGGANVRSASFTPFGEEKAEAYEIGLKSEFWDQRARLNTALFSTDYDDLQLDFNDPLLVGVVETINAKNTVEMSGMEVELTLSPLAGLLVGLSYAYIDSHMPLQPNPLNGNALTQFYLPLSPRHAGALTLDYTFSPINYGVFSAHLGATSTDKFSYSPYGEQRTDAYTLINARLTLSDISLGQDAGALKASLWGKNLMDEEYIVDSFPVGDPAIAIAQAFGEPRTFGIDINYTF